MTDNNALLQALQAIQQKMQQQSQQLQQQSQQQTEQSTKILEALQNMNIREKPKRDNSHYVFSSDKYKEGDQVDPTNNQETIISLQASLTLQTSLTLNEAVWMALKAELTISKGKSNSKFKNKPDLNQSLNQSGKKTQLLNSNEAEKNKSTYAKRGEWYKDESENEECFIRPEDVLDEEEDDVHESYSYVVRNNMFKNKEEVVIKDT
nr:hypothetical protein [Tanacetum cinerariifolium]